MILRNVYKTNFCQYYFFYSIWLRNSSFLSYKLWATFSFHINLSDYLSLPFLSLFLLLSYTFLTMDAIFYFIFSLFLLFIYSVYMIFFVCSQATWMLGWVFATFDWSWKYEKRKPQFFFNKKIRWLLTLWLHDFVDFLHFRSVRMRFFNLGCFELTIWFFFYSR